MKTATLVANELEDEIADAVGQSLEVWIREHGPEFILKSDQIRKAIGLGLIRVIAGTVQDIGGCSGCADESADQFYDAARAFFLKEVRRLREGC